MHIFLLAFFTFFIPLPSQAQSLSELYQLAERQSEILGSKENLIEQANLKYYQALGTVLPTIGLDFSQTKQGQGASELSGSITNLKFSGKQPLFRGLSEYFGLFQAGQLIKSEQQSQRAEKLRLREQVAARLFKYLSLEAELRVFSQGKDTLSKRVQELNGRVKSGRSKRSDVLSAEANLESLKSQIKIFEAQRDIELQNLIFLTGLQERLRPPSLPPLRSEPPNDEILKLATSHPRVLAESHKLSAAQLNRSASIGQQLPTADFSGNYYLKRTGALKDVSWDLRLDVSLPIFQGFSGINKVREAYAKERFAIIELQRVQRESQLQIQADLTHYKARREELKSLERASQLSEAAYKEQSKQYDLGLVSNLDVLSSLTSYHEAKRSFDRSLHELAFLEEKLRLLQEATQ